MSTLVKSFEQVTASDIAEIGKRNYAVVMNRKNDSGQAPDGFFTTSMAYWYFLDTAQLFDRLLFEQRNVSDKASLIAARCQEMILSAKIPYSLHKDLVKSCQQLSLEKSFASSEIELSGSIIHEQFPSLQFKALPEVCVKLDNPIDIIEGVKQLYACLFEEKLLIEMRKLGYRHMDLSVSCCISTSFQLQLNAA